MTARPVRIGCSGWNYDDWRGRVYPPGCPPRRWLAHYATLFDTVEVNSTFYRLAGRRRSARWVDGDAAGLPLRGQGEPLPDARQAADGTSERGVERLYAGIEPLARSPKLGPVLWQLPANFHRDDERLERRARRLPPGRHCFEFRHPSWFVRAGVRAAARAGAALVIGDDPRGPLPASS